MCGLPKASTQRGEGEGGLCCSMPVAPTLLLPLLPLLPACCSFSRRFSLSLALTMGLDPGSAALYSGCGLDALSTLLPAHHWTTCCAASPRAARSTPRGWPRLALALAVGGDNEGVARQTGPRANRWSVIQDTGQLVSPSFNYYNPRIKIEIFHSINDPSEKR